MTLGRQRVLPPLFSPGRGPFSSNVGGWLVLPQALVNDLSEQAVTGPFQIRDLGDQLRPHPMDAREHERRAEAASTGRWHVKRHPIGRKRLQARCEPRQLAARACRAGAAPSVPSWLSGA
jgi:hypothetical protein